MPRKNKSKNKKNSQTNNTSSKIGVAQAVAKQVRKRLELVETIKQYSDKANAGCVEAQIAIGHFYSEDENMLSLDFLSPVEKKERAIHWFTEAADKGNGSTEAMFNLGQLYLREATNPEETGENKKTALQTAIDWYDCAAKKDMPNAQNTLADIYCEFGSILGLSEKTINDKAFVLYEAAERNDHARATFSLGKLHQTKGNLEEAGRLITKALKLNCDEDQMRLGLVYMNTMDGITIPGLTEEQRENKAFECLSNAATQGYVSAKIKLAELHNQTNGRLTDKKNWMKIVLDLLEQAKNDPKATDVERETALEKLGNYQSQKKSASDLVGRAYEKATQSKLRASLSGKQRKNNPTPEQMITKQASRSTREKSWQEVRSEETGSVRPTIKGGIDLLTTYLSIIQDPSHKTKTATSARHMAKNHLADTPHTTENDEEKFELEQLLIKVCINEGWPNALTFLEPLKRSKNSSVLKATLSVLAKQHQEQYYNNKSGTTYMEAFNALRSIQKLTGSAELSYQKQIDQLEKNWSDHNASSLTLAPYLAPASALTKSPPTKTRTPTTTTNGTPKPGSSSHFPPGISGKIQKTVLDLTNELQVLIIERNNKFYRKKSELLQDLKPSKVKSKEYAAALINRTSKFLEDFYKEYQNEINKKILSEKLAVKPASNGSTLNPNTSAWFFSPPNSPPAEPSLLAPHVEPHHDFIRSPH